MAAHVVCITSSGGLPVFSRRKGGPGLEPLPFPTIGSLNGVHMYGKAQRIELLNALMEDHAAVWKEFYDSLILIAISSGCTVQVLNKFLEAVFDAIVLIIGIDEVKSQRNIERIKRELRVCYPLVDRLIDALDYGDSTNKHSSDLIQPAETILCSENHLFQITLEAYTECVDSVYCCLLIHGKIAVATESWWSMHANEIKLLSLLATLENSTNSKDIPVFLPRKSPNVAYRFVACSIISNVQVCCLCGPTPTLEDIEITTARCFKASAESLESAIKCHPRNFPGSVEFENGVLGILLVNPKLNRYVISSLPTAATTSKPASSGSHRLDILRTFYYQAVLSRIVENLDEQLGYGKKKTVEAQDKGRPIKTVARETYWCSEYHKCYAAMIEDNVVCVLFNSTVPNHTMRIMAPKILKIIVGDKQLCWLEEG